MDEAPQSIAFNGRRQAVQLRLVSGRETAVSGAPWRPAHQDRRAFGLLKIDGMSTLRPRVAHCEVRARQPVDVGGDEADVAGSRSAGSSSPISGSPMSR